ncbi:hypothetical protein NKI18_17715 [Mesorhizobium sp. M0800]
MKKALFMRTFTQDLTVLITDPSELSPDKRSKLKRAGIKISVCRPNAVCATGRETAVELIDGGTLSFDTIYPAMDSTIRSKLAVDLGLHAVIKRAISSWIRASAPRSPDFMQPEMWSTRSISLPSHSATQRSLQPTCTTILQMATANIGPKPNTAHGDTKRTAPGADPENKA